MFYRIEKAINSAMDFMVGFEDDPEQESVKSTLTELRNIISDFEDPSPVRCFFVFVDRQAAPSDAFWSNMSGWGKFANATVFSDDEVDIVRQPITETSLVATKLRIDAVPGFLAETTGRMTHIDNRAYTNEGTHLLKNTGEANSDFRMIGGRSVYIDVRNLSIQLTVQNDGLSIYAHARGTQVTLFETYVEFNEASNAFFGDFTSLESLKENLEAHSSNWESFVESHLLAEPTYLEDSIKAILPDPDVNWTFIPYIKEIVVQTVAALPDPVFASKYGIDPDAIKALQKLVDETNPLHIRQGIKGADELLLKAWPSNEAPMDLIYELRKNTMFI